jgi:hypothetical protein
MTDAITGQVTSGLIEIDVHGNQRISEKGW